MRILITTHVWEPEVGVPQRRWAWLTRVLVGAGHEVQVVAPPPHYPSGRITSDAPEHQRWRDGPGENGEHVWRTTYVPHDRGLIGRMLDETMAMLSGLWVTHRRIRAERPDVLMATAPPLPAAITATLMGKMHRVPVVLDVRDSWPDLFDHVHDSRSPDGRPEGRGIKKPLFSALAVVAKRAVGWAYRNAAAVITTSHDFSRTLRSRGVARTLCVYNVADLPQEPLPPPPTASPTLNLLYAGTTGRAQELASALRAVAAARRAGADVRLRIIGGGAHMRTLRRNSQRLGLPVEFLKRVSHDELLRHYEWADTVLVQLQDWPALETAIPSKIFEIMALGRHITGSLDGAAAHILEGSGAGDRVPAQDEAALADLLTDLHADRTRLLVGERGPAWLAQHARREDFEAEFLGLVTEVGTARQRTGRRG